jgi:hypothetical protein
MFKIEGLDKLQRELKEASSALKSLNGNIATVHYDPDNATSVQAAIRSMERAIDAKVARYQRNPLVADLASQMKKEYRAEITTQAKNARSKGPRP